MNICKTEKEYIEQVALPATNICGVEDNNLIYEGSFVFIHPLNGTGVLIKTNYSGGGENVYNLLGRSRYITRENLNADGSYDGPI